jgi:hypothetical protein
LNAQTGNEEYTAADAEAKRLAVLKQIEENKKAKAAK